VTATGELCGGDARVAKIVALRVHLFLSLISLSCAHSELQNREALLNFILCARTNSIALLHFAGSCNGILSLVLFCFVCREREELLDLSSVLSKRVPPTHPPTTTRRSGREPFLPRAILNSPPPPEHSRKGFWD